MTRPGNRRTLGIRVAAMIGSALTMALCGTASATAAVSTSTVNNSPYCQAGPYVFLDMGLYHQSNHGGGYPWLDTKYLAWYNNPDPGSISICSYKAINGSYIELYPYDNTTRIMSGNCLAEASNGNIATDTTTDCDSHGGLGNTNDDWQGINPYTVDNIPTIEFQNRSSGLCMYDNTQIPAIMTGCTRGNPFENIALSLS